jgi:hypothetical protein
VNPLLILATALLISGPAYVLDGNTVVVAGMHIRLKGVGRRFRADLPPEKTHRREVGYCTTADGIDINQQIIARGAALSSPRFDTRYLAFEQPAALAAQPRVLLRAEAVIARALSVRRLQTLTPRGPRRPDALRPGITFGEMRESGVRDVLIYCRDRTCTHHITISADRWLDHVRLSDIEPDFVCTACGKRGAEVRPKFSRKPE